MPTFSGFASGKADQTAIPEQFFTELLAEIDSLPELKVTLYVFWFVSQMEESVRYFKLTELAADQHLMEGLGPTPREANIALEDGMERAVIRGTFLKAVGEAEGEPFEIFLVNTPKGRAAMEGLLAGKWNPLKKRAMDITVEAARPTIFALYEENYGPLTPMIADILRDAAEQYSMEWIEAAIQETVLRNIRNWKYTEAILKRWEEGEWDD